MSLSIIILAAGRGKRMNSAKPKGMHTLGGKPLLSHIITTATQLKPDAIYVVIGHGSDQIREYFKDASIQWVEQTEQLGTGHAVQQVLPLLNPKHQVLILYGDAPLLSPQSLEKMNKTQADLTLLIAAVKNPHGLGRIVRNEKGDICKIVEEKDATLAEKNIHEIYSGIMSTSVLILNQWLPQLKTNNQQQEYYLPDVINLALNAKQSVSCLSVSEDEIIGINDKAQLARAERIYQLRLAEHLMQQGLQLMDPARFDLRGNLSFENDVCIDTNVILEGDVTLGAGVSIGPNCYLRNVTVSKNVYIKANSVIEDAIIEDNCIVGPFARIRPGTLLKSYAHVGNFVEIKQSTLGMGSKVNHLSYIGDSLIGAKVNIGAGTITCNYDGITKHQTIIEDGAFIGSNTSLVAPITIGANATIGAGSTLTQHAPADTLTLGRSKQVSVKNWKKRPLPKDKES